MTVSYHKKVASRWLRDANKKHDYSAVSDAYVVASFTPKGSKRQVQ